MSAAHTAPLQRIEELALSAIATDSRDRDDWKDDMLTISGIAHEALQQPAADSQKSSPEWRADSGQATATHPAPSLLEALKVCMGVLDRMGNCKPEVMYAQAAIAAAPASQPPSRDELSVLPIFPQAVFDEHGDPADDRVQDYGLQCWRAALAATAAQPVRHADDCLWHMEARSLGLRGKCTCGAIPVAAPAAHQPGVARLEGVIVEGETPSQSPTVAIWRQEAAATAAQPTDAMIDAGLAAYSAEVSRQTCRWNSDGTRIDPRARVVEVLRAALAAATAAQPSIPTHCPHCGTHEVALTLECHNSACVAYAESPTVYTGWKTADAPAAGATGGGNG